MQVEIFWRRIVPVRENNMKQCAIVRNGSDIIKVVNLKRKYNKIINNPIMEIIEECSLDDLESRFKFYTSKPEIEEYNDDIKLYYYKDLSNNTRLCSIYPKDTSSTIIEITKLEYAK